MNSVDVVPLNISYSNDIIVVSYMNGQLVTFEKKEYLENTTNFSISGDIDEIKVIVWNSLE